MAPLPPSTRALHLLQAAASALHPTRTLPHLLHQRQSQTTPDGGTITVTPTNNNEDSDPDAAKTLSGGAIAGIVIGSIAGFLLLLWIIRSCTNLGAPPGEAVPGRPWYGGVKDENPVRHHGGRGRSPGERRSRSRGSRHEGYSHHHSHHHHGRSRSRRASVVEAVPVQEVTPVAVVREGRRRSGSRGYYGYGEGVVRDSRSRSRGRY